MLPGLVSVLMAALAIWFLRRVRGRMDVGHAATLPRDPYRTATLHDDGVRIDERHHRLLLIAIAAGFTTLFVVSLLFVAAHPSFEGLLSLS